MSTYSPKLSDYSSISFSHPSVESQKPVRPNVTISENGFITLDKKVSVSIKSKEAPNGAAAGQDVAINGTHEIKNLEAIAANSLVKTTTLPQIEQKGGICQTIPYLHMIQSQLDFDIDYDSLWQCIPTNLTGSVPADLLSLIGREPAYSKLYNLLFSSGTCFSVGEIPKKCNVEDETQRVGGPDNNSYSCDSACSRRIKITTISTPPIRTEKDLCDRLNNLGPMLMSSTFSTTHKLTVLSENKDLTWDDIKDMDFAQLNNLLSDYSKLSTSLLPNGHVVTITSCVNGVFTVRNSWVGEKEFQLSWSDIQQDFNINGYIIENLYAVPIHRYYPVVEECEYIGDRNSKSCKDIHCIELGYDGAKPNSDPDECECYCEPVTAPAKSKNLPWKNCINAGQTVQKELKYDLDLSGPEYIYKKECNCPEHPQPDKYRYDGPDCCEISLVGTWCKRYYCDQTNRYYMNGVEVEGSSQEFEQIGESAVGWEKGSIYGSIYPRKVPCVKEEMPPICSGSEIDISPSTLNFNIQTVSSLRLI